MQLQVILSQLTHRTGLLIIGSLLRAQQAEPYKQLKTNMFSGPSSEVQTPQGTKYVPCSFFFAEGPSWQPFSSAKLPFSTLTRHYMDDFQGRDISRPGRVRWWAAKFGDRALCDISTDDIRQAIEEFSRGQALRWDGVKAGGKPKFTSTGRNRSPATTKRMRAALSSLFRYAVDEGLFRSNPVQGARGRAANNKRVRFLSNDERAALLLACRCLDYR